MVSLSAQEFDLHLSSLRPALLAMALRQTSCYDDAEDLIQETLQVAWQNLDRYTGRGDPAELGRWISGILINTGRENRRRTDRVPEQPYPGAHLPESAWAILHSDPGGEAPIWLELRHELRLRLRFADLEPIERACVVARLDGEPQRVTARRLGVARYRIPRIVRKAICKLRACPVGDLIQTYEDDSLWRMCAQVTVYRRPPRTGAMLAREQLRRLR